MAFIGLVFIGIFIVLLIIDLFLMRKFFTLAAEFKIAGREKQNKKKKIAGNVFLMLGILFAMPFVAISISLVFHACFTAVTLPDGETKYVSKRDVIVMRFYVTYPDENSLNALEKLLDKNSALVFHHDINRRSILDYGLRKGNADIVRIALEHGAFFDNPVRYEHMAYVASSMEDYLGYCSVRAITEDDLEIAEIMFENNASTALKKPRLYSNVFGEAVWAVLYNDETVTDTELAFLQVFMDHGFSSDRDLLLVEEAPVGHTFSDEYYADVARDSNYDRLMEIIGK